MKSTKELFEELGFEKAKEILEKRIADNFSIGIIITTVPKVVLQSFIMNPIEAANFLSEMKEKGYSFGFSTELNPVFQITAKVSKNINIEFHKTFATHLNENKKINDLLGSYEYLEELINHMREKKEFWKIESSELSFMTLNYKV